jgi:hypothetical protein
MSGVSGPARLITGVRRQYAIRGHEIDNQPVASATPSPDRWLGLGCYFSSLVACFISSLAHAFEHQPAG